MARKIHLVNVEILVTTICTLKCKLCANYIPYALNKEHLPFEDVSNDIDALFKLCSTVERIMPMGGEPLIYPCISEFMEKLLKNYRERIGYIRIDTNCTVMPSQVLLDLAARENMRHPGKIDFLLSNYGETSSKFEEVSCTLKEMKIPFRIDSYTGSQQYFGGWVDFGLMENEHPFPTEFKKNSFRDCGSANTYNRSVYKGKLYPCCRWLAMEICGLSRVLETPVNLYGDKEEALMKLDKYDSGEPFASCAFCNGISKHSKRFPGGEQLR